MPVSILAKPVRLALGFATTLVLSACGGGDAPSTESTAQPAGTSAAIVGNAVPPVVVTPTVAPTALQAFVAEYPASRLNDLRAAAPQKQQRIGANVGRPSPWSSDSFFVDIVMQAGHFGSPAQFGSSGAPLAADGWPAGDFGLELLSNQKYKTWQVGQYTVAFQGNASTVRLNTDVEPNVAVLETKQVGTQTIMVFDVKRPFNLLGLTATVAKDGNGVAISPIKNLKVIRPGYTYDPLHPERLPLYTTEYVNHVKRFSALRFMDFLHTNTEPSAPSSKPEGAWAQRPTPANKLTAYRGPVGQPWERVVALGVAAQTDIWINVPGRANDEYYQKLAEFMRDNLPSNLRIYVEYGNEMWNSQFVQAMDLRQEALTLAAANSSGEGARINYDGIYSNTQSDYTKYTVLTQRLYADRLTRISQAFKTAFGSNFKNRVRVMLAWQIVDPLATGKMLEYVRDTYGAPSDYFYATSGAPYFGLTTDAKNKAKTTELTVSEILTAMDEDSRAHEFIARYEAQMAQAKRYGLKFVAYEGGPDTYGADSVTTKAAANRADGIFDICQGHLNRWAEAGGDLFMWYTAGAGVWNTGYGAWSLVEDIMDTTSAKTSCMDWASITPSPAAKSRHALTVAGVEGQTSTGGMVNGGETIRPWDQPLASETYANRDSEATWVQTGVVREFMVSSPAAHCYAVSLNVTLKSNGQGTLPLEFYVNGNKQSGATFAYAGTAGELKKLTAPTQVCLDKGMNAITLRSTQAYYYFLNTIQFE